MFLFVLINIGSVNSFGKSEVLYKDISAKEAEKLIAENPGMLILDVRTPGEYKEGHIKGAKLIPVQQLAERVAEIEDYKDKEILIYCRSGGRSVTAAEILQREGFRKLYNLQRGIRDWIKEGLPIEK